MGSAYRPVLNVLLAVLLAGRLEVAGEPAAGTVLPELEVTANSGEKPQSKVWFHAGDWWAVLASQHDGAAGTWLWRLDEERRWSAECRLTEATCGRADVRASGDVTHVLVHAGATSQLVSLEYSALSGSYCPMSAQPVDVTFAGRCDRETATIDLDTTGRLWLATDCNSKVEVYYADPPYASFDGPVVVGEGIATDDICAITALGGASVGVLWSNQQERRFEFREHLDARPAAEWEPPEEVLSGSECRGRPDVADDHLNLAVGPDGSLYAAVKTSYDTADCAKIALLVRRASGVWEGLHEVDTSGTRGIVLVNETAASLMVLYTQPESGGDIVARESALSPIAFAPPRTLLSGRYNNVTSTKQSWSGEVVLLAAEGNEPCAPRRLGGLLLTVPQLRPR